MQEAIALTREKEIRLLEQAVMRAENEGLQVLQTNFVYALCFVCAPTL